MKNSMRMKARGEKNALHDVWSNLKTISEFFFIFVFTAIYEIIVKARVPATGFRKKSCFS